FCLAVQVSASPNTHTYRLFALLKIGAALFAAAEEANYTPPTHARQHFHALKSNKIANPLNFNKSNLLCSRFDLRCHFAKTLR
ncbi:hypothetical protein, partial [Paludibacterium paludis]|uniref:hypothetical protein n=1 Tax=Paludibacterium paludis TaxID=1225769 RepID=UPI001E42A650